MTIAQTDAQVRCNKRPFVSRDMQLHMRSRLLLVEGIVFVACLVAGTSGCGTEEEFSGSEASPLTPAGAWLEILTQAERTVVQGAFAKDQTPGYSAERAGEYCQIRRYVADCGAPCAWGESCVGGVCTPEPPQRSAGTLAIEGRGTAKSVPFGPTGYTLVENDIVWPAETVVTVSAPGGEIGGFSAVVKAVAPFAELQPTTPQLVGGRPMRWSWSNPDPSARIRVTLVTEREHGQPPPVIVDCDIADTGTIEVPAEAVTAIVDPDNWGCGRCNSSSLRRYTHQQVEVEGLGNVEVRAASEEIFVARGR